MKIKPLKPFSHADKNLGLRPIGVGEVLSRIAGKVIVSVLKNDVIHCAGSPQVCAGQEVGIEAGIEVYSFNSMCNNENNDAELLVDASNKFNSLNREVFLRNILYICLQYLLLLRTVSTLLQGYFSFEENN